MQLLKNWQAIGAAMAQQMLSSVQAGGNFFDFVQSLWQPGTPVMQALLAFLKTFHTTCLPVLLGFLLLGLLYWPLQEAGTHKASLGKRVFGLHVLDAAGNKLRRHQAFKRHLAGSLSWLSLNVGHAMVLAPAHLALHDRLAGSQVIWRENARRKLPWWGYVWLLVSLLLPAALLAWLMLLLTQSMTHTAQLLSMAHNAG